MSTVIVPRITKVSLVLKSMEFFFEKKPGWYKGFYSKLVHLVLPALPINGAYFLVNFTAVAGKVL